MKILFYKAKPPAALLKRITSNQFVVASAKNLSQTIPPFDWLIAKVESIDTLTQLRALAESLPKSHLTLLVSQKKLNDVAIYDSILSFPPNGSVLPEDSWASFFWVELRNLLNRQSLLKQLSNSASTETKQLLDRSRSIVSQLEKDVTLAEAIQRNLIPKTAPKVPGITITTKYMPAAGLGGDYFDVFEFGDKKRLGILIADSKTHGMAAALLSVLLKIRTDEMKERFPDSASFVSHLNRQIQDFHAKDLASLSLLYGFFDRSTLRFQYTSAGLLTPLWVRGKKVLKTTISENPAIGTTDHFDFKEQTIQLKPGDSLLFHTDGLEAPVGVTGENVMRAVERILENHPTSPDAIELQNEFLALIDRFRERHALPDDLTVIQMSIDPGAMYVAKQVS